MSEILAVVAQFAQESELARTAGFDGVEIHGANGYLLDQFLKDGTNRRTDAYGFDVPSRLRLVLEVTREVVAVWGAGRVGLRISPLGVFNDMYDSDPHTLFTGLARELNALDLAFLHIIEPLPGHATFQNQEGVAPVAPALREIYAGTVIINGGYGKAEAERAIAENSADLVSFGGSFLANPDLPERFRRDLPLNAADAETFYGGDERGYTDYPFLVQV